MERLIFHIIIISVICCSCKTRDEIDPRRIKFYLHDNGITCMCPHTRAGDKGFINGIEYESVDNDLIWKRKEEGVDMTKLCTSMVTDLTNLFSHSEFNQPIGNWDMSNVIYMNGTFRESTFDQSIEYWDVSKVEYMIGMFQDSQFNQPIAKWSVSRVTNMSGMFRGSQFNQPIGNWDVSQVFDMGWTFQGSLFNQSISEWDVGNVRTMEWMFSNSNFNLPIEDWDVSEVTEMSLMFFDLPNHQNRTQFNQDISKWCVAKIPSEPTNFSLNAPLNSENKPKWGTCPN